ncbi:DUF4384 domain-containing protein [Deinococcus sp. HMF7620]|uniref:DUF4384 domain-containing protein n=1 Tax=Deinococcus arboris TaxID=2682977 RepID=A0A7C9HXX0_9DEIO|nr:MULTISPECIES: DUF4384 domain-containing protein [Deinococcus]MBZ9752932.1 DUF4384 domain-containing protein [Deinococcus betulae]MVN86548.1 DUF4384 domain-containing protein [Deinococcus arboris]
MKVILPLTLLTAALGCSALAAPTLSAQSIIVNPAPTSLSVKVWTDRDTSGAATPNYAPGEKIRLFTQVNQDAYVYLFNVDPSGQVDLILPNRFQGGANFLKANAVKVFPAAGDPFTFDIAAPYGVNKVLALASLKPLNLDQIATFKSQQNSFADVNVKGQQGLAQALSIVVNPAPQNSWITDTASYNVAARASAAQLKTTPTSPVAAAPAPTTSAPRTAQALSVTVGPWGNAREWSTTVDGRADLKAQHDQYAAKLKAEGYTLVKTSSKPSEIKSEFRKGSSKAELTVKRKGNRLEIKVERSS